MAAGPGVPVSPTVGSLAEAVGGRLRRGGADDTVLGVTPGMVARPASTAEAAALLSSAAGAGLSVMARGTGTRVTWGGAPSQLDLVVDTTGLADPLEHAAGDLVVRVGAGRPLDDLQRVLARSGQRLAVDPLVSPGASGSGTVGGMIATGASGPLRASAGAVRDLLIGVTFVRADGRVAHGGGRVVKNVAGYDLPKLLAGSWGTLGLVTEAVFRLHPLPAAMRWVVASGPAAAGLAAAAAVVHSQLVVAAAELDVPPAGPATLAILLEGSPAGVATRGAAATAETADAGLEAVMTEDPPPWWGRPCWEPGGTALRVTSRLSRLGRAVTAIRRAAAGLEVGVRASPGIGVVHAGLPAGAPAGAVAGVVAQLREQRVEWDGDVVVLDAPPEVRAVTDPWGPVAGLELMRRVKDQFDPDHRLAPGRFVGGI